MNKTASNIEKCNLQPITVETEMLRQLLNCGRSTAVSIGEQAHAKVQIGKRVLWNINKIQQYINELAV